MIRAYALSTEFVLAPVGEEIWFISSGL